MEYVAIGARGILPLAAPLLAAAASSKDLAKDLARYSFQSMPRICAFCAFMVFLLVCVAWVIGPSSISRDIAYLVLVGLLAWSTYLSHTSGTRQSLAILSVATYMTAFIVYTAARSCESSEQIILSPAVSLCLLDMILCLAGLWV